MKKYTIIMQLQLDGQPTSYQYQQELRTNKIYFFDIPHIDLSRYAQVRVKITVEETVGALNPLSPPKSPP